MVKNFTISITFDNYPEVFFSGELLKGKVKICVDETIPILAISLNIFGKAKVHWYNDHTDTRDDYRAEEHYINRDILLSSVQASLKCGTNSFPFEYRLPENLPSSFFDSLGYIKYSCHVKVERPRKPPKEHTQDFKVIRHLNLNLQNRNLSSALEGKDRSSISCCLFCISGNVSAVFRINKQGFVPGENIIINAIVKNQSNTSLNYTAVAIKQYGQFFGKTETLFSSGRLKPKNSSQVILRYQRDELKAGRTEKWVDVPITVPSLPPSGLAGCEIINLSYVIKFYVNVNYGENLKMACDIIIGTIPLTTQSQTTTVSSPSRAANLRSEGQETLFNQALQPLPSNSAPLAPPSYEETMNNTFTA